MPNFIISHLPSVTGWSDGYVQHLFSYVYPDKDLLIRNSSGCSRTAYGRDSVKGVVAAMLGGAQLIFMTGAHFRF